MFEETTIIQTPNFYINEPGVMKKIPDILDENHYQHAVVLTDTNVKKAVQHYVVENFFNMYDTFLFEGSCTFDEIDRLTHLINGADVLVAFGGGQLLDTAKCVADNLSIALINVPTLPSNCACITTKSIVYSDAHEMIANVRHKQGVQMVLVEPKVQQEAPYAYILSGIGDTLAKWYEIRRRLTVEKSSLVVSGLARHFIQVCRDEMLKVTNVSSLSDVELRNLVDTIFLVAASVDGWAGLDGRSVAAHNVYNAYIKIYPQHTSTHGEIVAVGILDQLAIEKNWDDFNLLTSYYKQIGLSLTLRDLGLNDEKADLKAIANEMAKKDNVRMQTIFPNISADEILSALQFVEKQDVEAE